MASSMPPMVWIVAAGYVAWLAIYLIGFSRINFESDYVDELLVVEEGT